VPNVALSQHLSAREKHHDKQIWTSLLAKQLSLELLDVFSNVVALAYLLNNHHKLKIEMNVYSFQDIAISISYRLIRVRSLAGERPDNELENVLHLALTAFITPLFLTASTAPLLPQLLQEAAQNYQQHDSESRKIMLWVLFIGKSSFVFTNLHESWMIPMIAEASLNLGLRGWTDVHSVLSQFPWINLVHNNAGQELWEKVQKYSESHH